MVGDLGQADVLPVDIDGVENDGGAYDVDFGECVGDSCHATSCPSGNGLYCGNNPDVNLTAGVLYQCTNGVYTEEETCSSGCHVAAAGVNDYCENGASCPSGNGDYCGNNPDVNLQSGVLYHCLNGVYTVDITCTNGCHVAPAGTNDYCQ